MTTVTLQQIEAPQTELTKLIESFKVALPTTANIPSAFIELNQCERYAMAKPKTPEDILALLRGIRAEAKTLLGHFTELGAALEAHNIQED